MLLFALLPMAAHAQETLGSINGTVTDSSGAVVQGVTVKVHNVDTGLEQTATTRSDGAFSVADLPIGTYRVEFSKTGFKTDAHPQILVRGNTTSTVNASMQAGEVSTTVTVNATPLLNDTDTTNGYTLSTDVIESTPLGTGSFTQLAILAPGVNADLLGGSGSNSGLGNQSIFANGQRDTSNSFSVNGVTTNNLFNGMSSSQVGTNRTVLNTGEVGVNNANGLIQTGTSVFDAIGEALPSPPPETIQELRVNTSMYDASQGANSGAHIELSTKSGTNDYHGQAYEYHQTGGWNASPFFFNATGLPTPPLHYNVFGGTFGGPIQKNKLFFFASYQGRRVTDELNGTSDVAVPPDLNNDRSAGGLATMLNTDFGPNPCGGGTRPCTGADVDPVAQKILSAKTSSGGFFVPTPNANGSGFNAVIQGPPSTFTADQVNGNIDYNISSSDRLSGKYYFQRDPTTNPFAESSLLGFPQSLNAGSQTVSLNNTVILTPNLTWEQRGGFVRLKAISTTGQSLTPTGLGMNVFSNKFPAISITNSDGFFDGLSIGPLDNFANAGFFQNDFQGSSSVNWIHGMHSFSFGFNFDYTQLNVLNRNNQVSALGFRTFSDFVQGNLNTGVGSSILLDGETNRYYRSRQAGLYAQDTVRLKHNLSVNVGIRWDWDGPLWEKYGLLTNFYPQNYSYSPPPVDTVNSIGLVVAGNNAAFGTKGVSNSTLTGRQWVFEPRIGVAWSPSFLKNFVVRAGFGMYADRGEFFTELSPSAGLGISGPFGVTTEEPFTIPIGGNCPAGTMCLSAPFGNTPPPPPPNNLNGVIALVHNQAVLSGCAVVTPTCTPTSSPALPFGFGGYDPRNTLPYSENWTLDLQWQPWNTMVFDLAYVGNHGVHQVLPIPFNQPGIATPTHPINGQIYSYGFQAIDGSGNPLITEQAQTNIAGFGPVDGNTALRVPFIGYNPNANFWEAEGISHYNALQFSVTKRLSHGLTVTGSYTWSHTLDEGGGLSEGLFFNGNNPLDPRSAYGNASFDRTHVLILSYQYQFPKSSKFTGFSDHALNGWGFSGVTVAESGQPYSVTDFSGAVGGIYYSADDFITNPIVPVTNFAVANSPNPLGTGGIPGISKLNPAGFGIGSVLLQPGQMGVPPCGLSTGGNPVCDMFETNFSSTGRNLFRGPFQTRFDFGVFKNFKLTERFNLKYDAQFFNIFNHPSFDTPNNNVSFNGCFNPQPCFLNPPNGHLGVIQHTIGSPRFIQMALHLTF
ncbi:MAG TPA: TonB-dependent receptor [Candidatus Acidoferrales bacterium]|nr:TonB-dependent receptor [Candidatus Acidoferrales bacterium]